MTRLSRKNIKRDEVMETMGSVVDFLRTHTRMLLLAVATILVAGAASLVWMQVRQGQSERSNEALARAIAVYEAPIDPVAAKPSDPDHPSFVDEVSRRERAAALLEAVRSDYPSSAAADVAAVYLADLAAGDGAFDRARELWDGFLRRQKGHLLAAQVRLNRMALDRAQGRGEEVALELEAMVDQPAAELPQPVVLHQLGVTLEGLGRTAEARDIYRRLLEEHPTSPYSGLAQRQVDLLESELEG